MADPASGVEISGVEIVSEVGTDGLVQQKQLKQPKFPALLKSIVVANLAAAYKQQKQPGEVLGKAELAGIFVGSYKQVKEKLDGQIGACVSGDKQSEKEKESCHQQLVHIQAIYARAEGEGESGFAKVEKKKRERKTQVQTLRHVALGCGALFLF